MNVHTNLDLTSLLISSILFFIFSRVVFTFPPSAHWLLDFSGAYSYFSFSYAPVSWLLRGLFLLFFFLRPGFLTSPGLILTFLPLTPQLLDFLGAYSYFSFSYAPASWLLRGLFLLFFLLCPGFSISPGLILTFLSLTPRLLGFLGAYSYFSSSHAPTT